MAICVTTILDQICVADTSVFLYTFILTEPIWSFCVVAFATSPFVSHCLLLNPLNTSGSHPCHHLSVEDPPWGMYVVCVPDRICFCYIMAVLRASVPRLKLDDVFEQKNDVAKNVAEELGKVI